MKKLFAGLALGLLLAASALAQSYPPPQVQSIGPTDLFQDVPNGAPSAGNVYAPASLLGNYGATLGGNNIDNVLIGSDATTNLFQRGTTGASQTTTVAYGGPDRWAYWSGTSTAMTVSQDSTAGDLPANSKYAFKMARTSGQTGVVQMCMAQEVETANSYGFRGTTAEVDFYAVAGANFSAANSIVTAYVITGTGADEGMQKLAWGLNAGGGGSTAWAGQVNTGVNVTISTAVNRYTVAVPTPTGTTEVGLALCFTPVGTAGTNDYVAFSLVQMGRNSALTTVAGTAGVALDPNDRRARSVARRPMQLETSLQQRYTYSINEAAIGAGQIVAGGGTALGTTTTCSINIRFPVTMRVAPTYANALSASTFKITSASQAATILATPFSATLVANSVDSASINFTTTGMTAKDGCELVSAAGTGQMLWSAEL